MANKRIRKKKAKQQPTLQEAWNVVADCLKDRGRAVYFVDNVDSEPRLHDAYDSFNLYSTLGGK